MTDILLVITLFPDLSETVQRYLFDQFFLTTGFVCNWISIILELCAQIFLVKFKHLIHDNNSFIVQ